MKSASHLYRTRKGDILVVFPTLDMENCDCAPCVYSRHEHFFTESHESIKTQVTLIISYSNM